MQGSLTHIVKGFTRETRQKCDEILTKWEKTGGLRISDVEVEVENAGYAGKASDETEEEGCHECDDNSNDGVGHGLAGSFGTFATATRGEVEKSAHNEHDEGGESDEGGGGGEKVDHQTLDALDRGDLANYIVLVDTGAIGLGCPRHLRETLLSEH